MARSANSLFSDGRCFACVGVSMTEALTLQLEADWLLALDPAADVSVNGLLEEAKCLACFSDGDVFSILQLGLLSKIAEAI